MDIAGWLILMVSERIWDVLCLTVGVPKVQQMTKDGPLSFDHFDCRACINDSPSIIN